MTAGASVTAYSDEAWAQLVHGVTSQHVGRLRRVFQRFGDLYEQYEGLYWSHFQAALDWDDAEMWLEGAIQNEWSVSQMRGKRWETHGTPPEQQQAEVQQERVSLEESLASEETGEVPGSGETDEEPSVKATTATIKAPEGEAQPQSKEPSKEPSKESQAKTSAAEGEASSVAKQTRAKVDVESLPDDVAEAFECFKLAIIAHRQEGWQETTPESVVACLDALKVLVESE